MTMLMAARHPEPWVAASAWVGITDLVAWHANHADGKYGEMMRSALGGAPGDSAEVDAAIRIVHRSRTLQVASRYLSTSGRRDGHNKASVPIRHLLDAFNAIARAAGGEVVEEDEMAQICSAQDGELACPRPFDRVEDAIFGRKIFLCRETGGTWVTIFDGGHEGIDSAALAWFARHGGA